MTVFFCAKCGAEPGLQEFPDVPEAPAHDKDRDRTTRLAPSTVPRGYYAIDPTPWGAPFVALDPDLPSISGNRALLLPPGMTGMVPAGPRNSVIVHPHDVPILRLATDLGIHGGCCGPLGTGGRNMACSCRAFVATLTADCLGPHELHLDPHRVYAYSADAQA